MAEEVGEVFCRVALETRLCSACQNRKLGEWKATMRVGIALIQRDMGSEERAEYLVN